MPKHGLLLVNLGTPDSPKVPHVRRYLREFLMDPRVIDIAYPLRFLLVNGIIAPFRAGKSAEAYHSIWTEQGSPLFCHSRNLAKEVEARVGVPVALAMRYGSPSIPDRLRGLRASGVDKVTVLPLFPHYAMSSYESAAEAAKEHAAHLRMEASVVPPFYRNEGYISALAHVAAPYLKDADHVLFSFHGVPERHLTKSDPTGNICLKSGNCCDQPNPAHNTCYRHQCMQTVAHVTKAMNLADGSYSVAFQSRLGRDEWLKPATDIHLVDLAKKGVRRLAVICPSFTADCLETLEEIGIRGRNTFLAAGGEELTLVPCLNDHPAWAEEVVKMTALAGVSTARAQVGQAVPPDSSHGGSRVLDSVSTTLRIPASPETIWQNMMTYEEVPGRPPFPLRALIPVPLGSKGDKSRVGADIQCRYKGGDLVKRMTVVEPPLLMKFEVLEQRLGIEKRVEAVEGSYALRVVGDGTEVTLTTVYRTSQHPRFFWRPIERLLAHQLHRHILKGMRTAIAVSSQEPICSPSPSLSRH